MLRCVALCVLTMLTACGRDSGDDHRGTVAGNAGTARDAALDENVAAVLQTPGKASVQLLFHLADKPVVGKTGSLRLDFSAADPVPVLALKAESVALELGANAEASLVLPEAGATVHHALSFTPRQAGWAELIVRLTAGNPEGGATTEMRYAIPLLVAAASGSDESDPATKTDHANP